MCCFYKRNPLFLWRVPQLYFCEFCMAFFRHKEELRHHQARQACPRVGLWIKRLQSSNPWLFGLLLNLSVWCPYNFVAPSRQWNLPQRRVSCVWGRDQRKMNFSSHERCNKFHASCVLGWRCRIQDLWPESVLFRQVRKVSPSTVAVTKISTVFV